MRTTGCALAYIGSSVIYERMNALPRIRWASQSTVVPSQDQRVAMLSSGTVADDAVVLSDPGPAASGQPAAVQVVQDGTDSITTTVDAQGSGYLVVADADQVGWQATVDGHQADLVKADQGLVAVNVPAGTHTVTLRYSLPQPDGGDVGLGRGRGLAAGGAGRGVVVGASAAQAGAGAGAGRGDRTGGRG